MLQPSPQCDHLGGRALGRQLAHAGGALMNEISAHMKKAPESCLSHFAM